MIQPGMSRADVRAQLGGPEAEGGAVERYADGTLAIYRGEVAVQLVLPNGGGRVRLRREVKPPARRPFMVRYGLEDVLGGLWDGRGQLEWFCRDVPEPRKRLAKVTAFVQPRWVNEHTVVLDWSPTALQLALKEFLHHAPLGPGQDRKRKTDVPCDFLIVEGNTPMGRRARVLAEAEMATLALRQSPGSRIVVLDEIPEEECWTTLARLKAVGVVRRNFLDDPVGKQRVPLLEGDQPGFWLRAAAALAAAVDEDRHVKVLADWGDRCWFSLYRALADSDFKLLWSRVCDAPRDPDWAYDGAGRLLALTRRPRIRVDDLPFQDKLSPVRQQGARLAARGSDCNELKSLVQPVELQLLRRLEAFPHLSQHEPDKIAAHVIATAHEAEEFHPETPAQGTLARGVAAMLELGLQALAIPCASS